MGDQSFTLALTKDVHEVESIDIRRTIFFSFLKSQKKKIQEVFKVLSHQEPIQNEFQLKIELFKTFPK